MDPNFISFSSFSPNSIFPRDMGDGTFLLSSYTHVKTELSYTFITGITVFVPEDYIGQVTFSYPIQGIRYQDYSLSNGKWNVLEFSVTSAKDERDVVVSANLVMAPTLKIIHKSKIETDVDY